MIAVTINGWPPAHFETRAFAVICVDAALENDATSIQIEVTS
jgi:hypothetical protein